MIYDLSYTINDDLPVCPGDPHVKIKEAGVLSKDGFSDRLLIMGTHNGTHIDAPAHMLTGGKRLMDYSINRFICQATCIDARTGFSTQGLKKGNAVLFYTGASDYFKDSLYWSDYKVLDNKTVQQLIDKKTPLVGVDTGSFDKDEDFPIHKALLGADILLIENLTNLRALVGQTFELYALPLKLENDGAPARIVAKT